MTVLKYALDVLFLLTLILLAFIPKRGKLVYLFVIVLTLNLGIRSYLIYRGHKKDRKISNLENQLESVRQVATRDIYRPLSPELREELVLALQRFKSQYSDFDMKLSITPEKNNRNRDYVAKDLASLFGDAGFEVKATTPIITNLNGEVFITLNPADLKVANQLFQVIGKFINIKFQGREDRTLPRGTFKIHVAGDPLFSTEGIVSFR